MPKINVYLPNDLAEAVKEAGIPVSATCQRALRQAVTRMNATREAASGDLATDELAAHLESGLLVTVISAATARARSEGLRAVGTRHLLSALLADGDSRVTAILGSIGLHPDEVEGALSHLSDDESVLPVGGSAEQLSVPASEAVALAVVEAQASDSDDIGPEHLLLGLIAERDGVASKALRAEGATLSAARQALAGSSRAGAARARLGGVEAVLTEFADALAVAIHEQVEPLTDRVVRLERQIAATDSPEASARPHR